MTCQEDIVNTNVKEKNTRLNDVLRKQNTDKIPFFLVKTHVEQVKTKFQVLLVYILCSSFNRQHMRYLCSD